MKHIRLILFFAPLAIAADPEGLVLWKGAELKGYEKKLAPKMSDKKIANETLGTWGNNLAMIAHREGDGEAEVHERVVDYFIVESGEGTLVVGGTVPNGKTTAPGEIRGPSIDGGVKKKLGAGDVVRIPHNTPHQMLVEKGQQFTYMVIKVNVP